MKRKKSFTMLEMMVVITILTIFMTLIGAKGVGYYNLYVNREADKRLEHFLGQCAIIAKAEGITIAVDFEPIGAKKTRVTPKVQGTLAQILKPQEIQKKMDAKQIRIGSKKDELFFETDGK